MSKAAGQRAYKSGMALGYDAQRTLRLDRDRRDAIRRARPATSWWLTEDFYAQQHEVQTRLNVAPRPYTTS